MRSIFTTRTMAFRDRAIESPDAGLTAKSYTLLASRRLLLYAGLSARMPRGCRVDAAKLRICVVAQKGTPGKLAIARLRKEPDLETATWLSPSSAQDFQAGGGVEGADFTALRQISVVPSTDEEVVEVDVLEDLQAWAMRGEPNYGWILTGTVRIAGALAVRFSTRPALDVRYSGERTSGASALAGVHDARGG